MLEYRVHTVRVGAEHPAWPELDRMALAARRLRNAINYDRRQMFFADLEFNENIDRKDRKTTAEWKALPSKVAREVSRGLDADWRSVRVLRRTKGRRAQPPKYLQGRSRYQLRFSIDALRAQPAKRGMLGVAGMKLDLCPLPVSWDRIKEVRILPSGREFDVEIVWVKTVAEPVESPDWSRVAGADLGIDNLITVACDDAAVRPLIVDGRSIKSRNRFANVRSDLYAALLPNLEGGTRQQRDSTRREALWRHRNSVVKAELHTASKRVVDYCRAHHVTTLVIGWNPNWKTQSTTQSTMGRVGNRRFRSIPHRVLVNQITYKARRYGITVLETEESYTSKTSVLAGELPVKHHEYAAQRINRGRLKVLATGQILNADVNGACQIARKCKPEAFSWANGVAGEVGLSRPLEVVTGGGRPGVRTHLGVKCIEGDTSS
ncbi:IS200/IS605 family element transposase accessory protein TnpB [Nocardia sp. ET3-3]|uniref:IS200/IS605 family element transposase accessory protein TnpB n=1 Tax=Nocardia terrae TaxID=2675851 RepID=A0A7K1V6Z4_9NOCA|nr:RNA-guided endonuclease TnpB family protein [Nocardia terrae]MVU82232.1 IS200/IS605 family element transposase accessory protein TnpB [Nocardia terrae]